jgi:RNA recognition motif-containing protein
MLPNHTMSSWGAAKDTSSGWNKSSTNESSGAARSRSRSPPRRVRSPSPRGGAGASSGGSGGAVKLYVGNLSFNTNKDILFDTFGKFGTVVDAFVAMDRDAGRSKGFGFVTFEDPQAASAAKDGTNGQEIDGRTIRVDFAGEKPSGDRTAPRGGAGGSGGYGGASGGQQRRGNPACTLVISNLPYNVSWQTLKDHFRSAGNVRRADVNTGSDGRSSGSGVVEFSSPDEAQHAIRTLHDSSLNDRRISVALEGGSGGGGDSRSGGYEDRGRSSYSSSYDNRRGGDSYDDRRSAPSSYDRSRGYDDHDRRGSYGDDRRGSGGGYDRDGGRGDSRRSDNRDYERRRD